MTPPRNRIKRHVAVRAGDLVPHEMNPRLHTDAQRAALAALYDEVGFARSLLAYELPDGRLKLIDGHLRASMDPEQVVEVEVLDVTDTEARKLLLALDPLALMAGYEAGTLSELRAMVEPDSPGIRQIWETIGAAGACVQEVLENAREAKAANELPEQFLVVVECATEEQQTAVLERLRSEGLRCRTLLS